MHLWHAFSSVNYLSGKSSIDAGMYIRITRTGCLACGVQEIFPPHVVLCKPLFLALLLVDPRATETTAVHSNVSSIVARR